MPGREFRILRPCALALGSIAFAIVPLSVGLIVWSCAQDFRVHAYITGLRGPGVCLRAEDTPYSAGALERAAGRRRVINPLPKLLPIPDDKYPVYQAVCCLLPFLPGGRCSCASRLLSPCGVASREGDAWRGAEYEQRRSFGTSSEDL